MGLSLSGLRMRNKEEIHVEMPELQEITLDKMSEQQDTVPVGDAGCVSTVGRFLLNHIIYAIVFSAVCMAVIKHCTAAENMEKQQKRCYEYSKKALLFQGWTLAAYFVSFAVASSPGRTTTTVFVTMAVPLLLAMVIDVISISPMTKTKWCRALVYLSSILQTLSIFLMFISLDKAYGYAFIFVPVLISVSIGIAFFQRGADITADEDDRLDRIFDFSALILNWGAPITAVLCYSIEATDSAASITGYLFIGTVILSMYLMTVTTTLRDVPLTRLVYLYYLLAGLLFGTLIAAIVSLITAKNR